jgi:hypothetical protein
MPKMPKMPKMPQLSNTKAVRRLSLKSLLKKVEEEE